MKKLLLLLILITFSASIMWASVSDNPTVQTISGFVDDISYLYVSPFRYDGIVDVGYAGINLDLNDSSNKIVHQIEPTQTATLGYQIGSFTVLSTYENITLSSLKLVIEHEKLILDTDNDVTLEYELGVLYRLTTIDKDSGAEYTPDEDSTQICESTSSTNSNRQHKIEINLMRANAKLSSIQTGYIYFRLANGVTASATGQYHSVVTFRLEAL